MATKSSVFLCIFFLLAVLVDKSKNSCVLAWTIQTPRRPTARGAVHDRRMIRPLAATEDEAISSSDEVSPSAPPVKCPNCDQCDGSGRIVGGIGAVADWWPIKAYRPCPNFLDSGGTYQRSGQGLDEIAFGRDSTYKSGK